MFMMEEKPPLISESQSIPITPWPVGKVSQSWTPSSNFSDGSEKRERSPEIPPEGLEDGEDPELEEADEADEADEEDEEDEEDALEEGVCEEAVTVVLAEVTAESEAEAVSAAAPLT